MKWLVRHVAFAITKNWPRKRFSILFLSDMHARKTNKSLVQHLLLHIESIKYYLNVLSARVWADCEWREKKEEKKMEFWEGDTVSLFCHHIPYSSYVQKPYELAVAFIFLSALFGSLPPCAIQHPTYGSVRVQKSNRTDFHYYCYFYNRCSATNKHVSCTLRTFMHAKSIKIGMRLPEDMHRYWRKWYLVDFQIDRREVGIFFSSFFFCFVGLI